MTTLRIPEHPYEERELLREIKRLGQERKDVRGHLLMVEQSHQHVMLERVLRECGIPKKKTREVLDALVDAELSPPPGWTD